MITVIGRKVVMVVEGSSGDRIKNGLVSGCFISVWFVSEFF